MTFTSSQLSVQRFQSKKPSTRMPPSSIPVSVMFMLMFTLLQSLSLLEPVSAENTSIRMEDISKHLQQMQHQLDETLLRVKQLELHDKGLSPLPSDEALDEQINALSDRVNDQEDLIQDLDQKVGGRTLIRAFDATQFDFGGFLHSTFTHVNGENGSATSFDRLTFELLFKVQFSERFSAFFAQAFVRESNTRFTDTFQRTSPGFTFSGSGGMKTPLVIAWANYRNSDAFNIQIGRYITPFGIINIEH